MNDDSWTIGGATLQSRMFLGTALYPSPDTMRRAILASKAEVITVALRRQSAAGSGGESFWDYIKDLDRHLLPNTAGCRTAREAIQMAHMAREVFETPWIKLEVVGDDYNLQPDPFGLVEAAEALVKDGFTVFPYCTDDLVLCRRLLDVGCEILMPWAAPIGSAQGILNPFNLRTLRHRLPEVPLIVDAGLGLPSHAAQAMELGCDAILLNSAVALADEPVVMAEAFALAARAGRLAYRAGPVPPREMASPSTPPLDKPFWHQQG
ncbi:MAG: thiazole synthase [Candidatus Competibacteraceae bacterium]|nr:thiazole synthase [Candidatus Competibacteraceae bacterium]